MINETLEADREYQKAIAEAKRQAIKSSDCISRQAALDIFDDYNVAVENGQIEAYSRDRKRLCDLPPAQPEPCEDAVSRKTVKELMLKYGFLAPDMTVTEFVEDCLPPVTPKQRWISVTERLPEEDGRYLVCGAKGGIYHANYRGRWWTQVGCGGKLVPSVVAWMPLPKPWEGDAE